MFYNEKINNNHLFTSYLESLYKNDHSYLEHKLMTVCIAALSLEGNIVLAADRMIVTGNKMHYVSPVGKIYQITDKIAILIAGDGNFQSEVLLVLKDEIKNSSSKVRVKQVADRYIHWSQQLIKNIAERQALIPLGFRDMEDWQNRCGNIGENLNKEIADKLRAFIIPGSAIICGMDDGRANIYSSYSGSLNWENERGVIAVGDGALYAFQEFLSANHSLLSNHEETLFTTFVAKKKAELDLSVGESTDIAIIHKDRGFFYLPNDQIKTLNDVYLKTIEDGKKSRQEAYSSIRGNLK